MLPQENITNFLEKLGLSHSEIKFYAASLTLGIASVPEISQVAHIDRVTGYKVLDALLEKGLIELLVDKRRGKAVKALSPARLKDIVLKVTRNAKKLELSVEDIISQLQTIHKTGTEKPEISFYEGIEGIKKVYEDTLTSSEEILAYAGGKIVYERLGNFIENYFNRRTNKKIPIKVIMPNTKYAQSVKARDNHHLRESKLVDLPFDFGLEVNIYSDKVAIMEFEQKFGMIIKSNAFTQAQKEIFKLAWKHT